jgi:branched-chain amino acid transport system permease protein
VLAVLFGYVLEWAFFSYLYQRDHLQQVLMTYGLILVFEELRSILVGDDVHGVRCRRCSTGRCRWATT